MKKTISETARLLKTSNIPGIPSHIQEMLENAHHHIQETVNQLNELPLNMEEAGAHLKQAEDIVNRASRESEELVEQVILIEKIIQFGNRFRSQNHILSEQLKEAERRFYAFDYDDSYEIAAAAVEKAAPGAVEKSKQTYPLR